MNSKPRRISSRPLEPLRRVSCTCGTASRQKGHCIKCAAMDFPQYAQRFISGAFCAEGPTPAPGCFLSRLGSKRQRRQGSRERTGAFLLTGCPRGKAGTRSNCATNLSTTGFQGSSARKNTIHFGLKNNWWRTLPADLSGPHSFCSPVSS
jgi:hypothetical protein